MYTSTEAKLATVQRMYFSPYCLGSVLVEALQHGWLGRVQSSNIHAAYHSTASHCGKGGEIAVHFSFEPWLCLLASFLCVRKMRCSGCAPLGLRQMLIWPACGPLHPIFWQIGNRCFEKDRGPHVTIHAGSFGWCSPACTWYGQVRSLCLSMCISMRALHLASDSLTRLPGVLRPLPSRHSQGRSLILLTVMPRSRRRQFQGFMRMVPVFLPTHTRTEPSCERAVNGGNQMRLSVHA